MVDPIRLKKYLQKRKVAPLMDIFNHFRTEAGVVGPMLDMWVKKGKLKRRKVTKCCKAGCCKCDPTALDVYEWTGHE